MPKDYSQHYKNETSSLSGEQPIYLVEVTHPALAEAIRLVNYPEDVYSQGQKFVACAFRIRFPEDIASTMPRVPVSIDNIGRELTQWLEATNGGKGASFRIMQVMRDTPDVIEQEYTMTLLSTRQDVIEVQGELGYENMLDIPCLAALFTPENTPGLF